MSMLAWLKEVDVDFDFLLNTDEPFLELVLLGGVKLLFSNLAIILFLGFCFSKHE